MGCNLEDTDHATGNLRDPAEHASWLRRVREAAKDQGYGLVINARIDVFLSAVMSGSERKQAELVTDALTRAHAYFEAGADCVFPILLHEADALRTFTSGASGAGQCPRDPGRPLVPRARRARGGAGQLRNPPSPQPDGTVQPPPRDAC